MFQYKKLLSALVLCLLTLLAPVTLADAVCNADLQTCSTSYGVGEAFFGSGGQLGTAGNGCSTNYCAKAAAGETTVGNPNSTNFQAHAGYTTNRNEFLQMIVNTTSVDLGVISPTTTGTGTATFSVKSYLSSGYQVITKGLSPVYNGHQIFGMSFGPSVPGTEQFGMNLVANTLPVNQGADPVQIPNSTFSFGIAEYQYDTANKYKYGNSNIIASAPSSSGETDYTISYIMNVDTLTPGGQYTMIQSLIATATF